MPCGFLGFVRPRVRLVIATVHPEEPKRVWMGPALRSAGEQRV